MVITDMFEVNVNSMADEQLLEGTTQAAREEIQAIEDLYNYFIEKRNDRYYWT